MQRTRGLYHPVSPILLEAAFTAVGCRPLPPSPYLADLSIPYLGKQGPSRSSRRGGSVSVLSSASAGVCGVTE